MLTDDAIATHLLETVLNAVGEQGSGAPYGAAVERALWEALMRIGRHAMADIISKIEDAQVFQDGSTTWRCAVVSSQTYITLFGNVRAERGLYRAVRNGPTRCLVDERLGVLDRVWTPEAARLAALLLTEQTSRSAANFFAESGGMAPSRTRLERLPSRLGQTIEPHRSRIDEELREVYEIPEEAVAVAVSLDGVMVKLQEDSTRGACVARANEEGRQVRGPVASREASVGSVTFYNASGERLLTRRFARMPESGKVTLASTLRAELQHIRRMRPDLTVVAISDGAACNWRILKTLEPDHEVVDAFHTLEHVKKRLDRALGVNSHRTQEVYAHLKTTLLHTGEGHIAVFTTLESLEKEAGTYKPRKRRGKGAQPTFYELHHQRMRFAELHAAGLPIGSGVVEGTARYMVVDRLRRTGMRWKHEGGNAVLTLRQYAANGQFNDAWKTIMRLEAANANGARCVA